MRFPILIFGFLLLVTLLPQGCGKALPIKDVPLETLDSLLPLAPNDEWYNGRHTYGADSIIGNSITYRLATDSLRIGVDMEVTLLELHPKITSEILAFIHRDLLANDFIDSGRPLLPIYAKDQSGRGYTQIELFHNVLDSEGELFYDNLSRIFQDGNNEFKLKINIYPVFLNADWVTYKLYSIHYTGGPNVTANAWLHTYDRKNGGVVDKLELASPNRLDDRETVYTPAQQDSVRKVFGLADDGHPWPRHIWDWYRFRIGRVGKKYEIEDILGTWIGLGHLYDPRQILTINRDGTFVNVTEEALEKNSLGQMTYNYTQTIQGRYEYDSRRNLLVLKNWQDLEPNDENIEAYVMQGDPENKYMVIHFIENDTMYVADYFGDLWPYYRKR